MKQIIVSKNGQHRACLVTHPDIIHDDAVHQLWTAQYRDEKGNWVDCGQFSRPEQALEQGRAVIIVNNML